MNSRARCETLPGEIELPTWGFETVTVAKWAENTLDRPIPGGLALSSSETKKPARRFDLPKARGFFPPRHSPGKEPPVRFEARSGSAILSTPPRAYPGARRKGIGFFGGLSNGVKI